ncbi:MAG: hypothetical protein HZB15_01655 [Actinobacteria bacterium]|nr:hypothetical protein [Actinomycetota bacterium]
MTISFCADTLIHSPAAMLTAPASAPARPARRTTLAFTPLPAKPMTKRTFDVSPSLMPNTEARASPPCTARCPGCGSERWMMCRPTAARYRHRVRAVRLREVCKRGGSANDVGGQLEDGTHQPGRSRRRRMGGRDAPGAR